MVSVVQWLVLFVAGLQTTPLQTDAGIFPKSLWFLHSFGQADCTLAGNDRSIKSVLAKALADDRELSLEEVKDLISEASFKKFAGTDDRLSESELTSALQSATPRSRLSMTSKLRDHADFLSTSFDMVDPEHFMAMEELSDWIVENWRADRTLHILIACTGNSRRSILGATLGNMSATYYGFENVRFHSGGTTPSAFNERTIATLDEIGFQIKATGEEAERGDPNLPNRKYKVAWGEKFESIEFSKHYQDNSIPQSGFAVILVCNEADQECPSIPGASKRLSMKFLDPKMYDDGYFESQKYSERRDDIGRTFLAVFANARSKLRNRE